MTVTRAAAAGPLTAFTLVDATTNADLLTLNEGTVVSLAEHATSSFGVRVETASGSEIGSVGFELTGRQSHETTENWPPYSLYGDTGEGITGRALSAGAYRLRATAWPERDLGGAAMQTLEVAFTVVAPATPVSTDAALRSLTLGGAALSPAFMSATQRYTANVAHSVTSVTVTAAPNDANANVAFTPATDADAGTAGHQAALAVGDNPITVTVTARDGRTRKSYTVTVTRAAAPAVTVSFGQASYSATEGGTAAPVTVRLNADPERTVTIPLAVTGAGGATDGDWSLGSESVTFAPGETAKTVTVTATDDDVDDDGESVELRFGTLPDRVTASGTTTTTVSLADNDGPPVAVPSAGICGRTPAVRDHILAMLRYVHHVVVDCADATAADLAKIEGLYPNGSGIATLKPGDFAGLSGLTYLDLARNALRGLPAGVFSGLTAVTELKLSNNELDPIPFAVFDELPALRTLSLYGNPGYRSGVEVSPQALTIARGGSREYRVRLTMPPFRQATVSVSTESPGVTAAPAAVTFTSTNWFRAQAVTVRVAGDAAPGSATLRHTVSGYSPDTAPDVTVDSAAAARRQRGPPGRG